MKTITPNTKNWIKIATAQLKNGGIVLHPTDTAYGLAVDATNPNAIDKVFELKKRDGKPLIMVVKDTEQAEKYVELRERAKRVIKEFFPGALTLVLNKKANLPKQLTCGSEKVGIRQPDHPVVSKLSKNYPKPFTSTSANLSSHPATYSVGEALEQLDESLIDLAIDAGKLNSTPTSTVIDLTTEEIQILREGAVNSSKILRFIKEIRWRGKSPPPFLPY